MNDAGGWRPLLVASLFCCALALHPADARAGEIPVDLELVLAVDVSRSMDEEEQRIQRDGYVAAFRHPDVLGAIFAGRHKRIAVTYVEWAGTGHVYSTVPWRLIDTEDAANAFAESLSAVPLREESRTSISSGLNYAAAQFDNNGYQGIRQVIDISGDGPNNMGEPVKPVRDEIVGRGIVINGLPLILRPSVMSGFREPNELAHYYEDCVIGGIGAFLIAVLDRKEFPDAIRRKLILEMSERAPRVMLAKQRVRASMDCLIGEKIWRDHWE
jgi:hypothetical protein